jgi:peptidoglycan/xylan/chitin deacetylase (PgdA/CDA1 family)
MAPARRPLVLAYHGVDDVPLRRDPNGLFVRPVDLRRQIAKLHDWRYRFATFGGLAERVARGDADGWVALTFDDGTVDNLETLAPLLEAEGLPATVFVVSGWLGRPYPWLPSTRIMTAEEVSTLHAAGIEIGAHSTKHDDLSALGYEEARADLERSRHELESILGDPVTVASYPFGRATQETIRACRDAGYRAACRASGEGSWCDLHDLPRQDMDNRCSMLGFRLKRDDRYEALMSHLPARAARRLIRRVREVTR